MRNIKNTEGKLSETRGAYVVHEIDEGSNIDSQKISVNKKPHLEAWVKETLSYIEGERKDTYTNRKAEKKLRQKLKKEEVKHIGELYNLKSQYHEYYFKEFSTKIELKSLKSAKKKDKKKILELESNLKKFNSTKVKIEKNILELLRIVKSTNTNFKLSYLPTKQEQEIVTKNLQPVSSNNKKNAASANSSLINQPEIPKDDNNMQFSGFGVACSPNLAADSSKKIVTIRRVNIPNLSEPQVTVTAKGASPEEDKLLYTFINGQIIPASSLDLQTRNILTSQPVAIPRGKLNPLVNENELNLDRTEHSSCDSKEVQFNSAYQCNQILNLNFHEKNLGQFQRANDLRIYETTFALKEEDNATQRKFHKAEKMLNENMGQNILSSDLIRLKFLNDRNFSTKNHELNVKKKKIRTKDNGSKANKELNKETPNAFLSEKGKIIHNVPLYENKFDPKSIEKRFCEKMKKLNINTINGKELESYEKICDSNPNVNVSIMEQINRGVKVEELTLPPGITLTKVDPANVEQLKARKQSIESISHSILAINPCPQMTMLSQDVSIRAISHDKINETVIFALSKEKQ